MGGVHNFMVRKILKTSHKMGVINYIHRPKSSVVIYTLINKFTNNFSPYSVRPGFMH